MLGTFLDKATGLLNRNFLLAYWFPVFTSLGVLGLFNIWVNGTRSALNWWSSDLMIQGKETGIYLQLIVLVGVLIIITVLAYLLLVFTHPIIRFFEGYWISPLRAFFTFVPIIGVKSDWIKKKNKRATAAKDNNLKEYSSLHSELFFGYPSKEDLLMPTKLGNVLRAAEEYSKKVYGMDSILWWPRIWILLPDSLKNEIEGAMTPIVALLNFSSIFALISVLGSAYFYSSGRPLWEVCLVLFAGLALVRISYLGAVAQAQSYGDKIRSAIDLYRIDLLINLSQPLPENLPKEEATWKMLSDWLYTYDKGAVKDMAYDHENKSKDDGANN